MGKREAVPTQVRLYLCSFSAAYILDERHPIAVWLVCVIFGGTFAWSAVEVDVGVAL